VLFSFHAPPFSSSENNPSRENLAIHLLSLFLFDNEEGIGFRDLAGIMKGLGCIRIPYSLIFFSENEYREKTLPSIFDSKVVSLFGSFFSRFFLFDNEEGIGFRDSAGDHEDWDIFGTTLSSFDSKTMHREKTYGQNIYFIPSF
jgi:hypothetical protein